MFADHEFAPVTRRQLLLGSALGLGAAALTELLGSANSAAAATPKRGVPGILAQPHVRPRAKRVIYLFMQGGPSQLDLFDPKPTLAKRHGEELPDSIRMGQRITGMTAKQSSLPVAPSPFRFKQHGRSGAWISELLPELAGVADDLCIIRSVHTEAINHDPAITYLQTGNQQPGRPSFGSWVSYGLGTENRDLPAFTVLLSRGTAVSPADPLFARLWGAGFLPSSHQGVCFRSQGDPVLYLSNPDGVLPEDRRRMLDTLGALNREQLAVSQDPEIETRIAQYEMAYRMQTSVPELTDLGDETDETFALYGDESRTPGTFAANCLLARRLVERDVRFVQLYHRGWDQHYNLPTNLGMQCHDVDRACAGLVTDLKRRGLLDDTLVVWGGEFGRTTYSQGKLTATNFGRDHHGRCFTIWAAGGGMKPGLTYGETDDYCYGIARDGVHIHDLNATLLHALGIDHTRLTYKFQGRYFRLTDVEGHVVEKLFA
ncbi:MAG: sulfatase [Pirellula sp.]|nr:sulfatase [Pirellula sp.]